MHRVISNYFHSLNKMFVVVDARALIARWARLSQGAAATLPALSIPTTFATTSGRPWYVNDVHSQHAVGIDNSLTINLCVTKANSTWRSPSLGSLGIRSSCLDGGCAHVFGPEYHSTPCQQSFV
jgi:hypothetical protein